MEVVSPQQSVEDNQRRVQQQEKARKAATAKKQEKAQNMELLKVFLESLGFVRKTDLFQRTLAAVTARSFTDDADPLLVCHPEAALGQVNMGGGPNNGAASAARERANWALVVAELVNQGAVNEMGINTVFRWTWNANNNAREIMRTAGAAVDWAFFVGPVTAGRLGVAVEAPTVTAGYVTSYTVASNAVTTLPTNFFEF